MRKIVFLKGEIHDNYMLRIVEVNMWMITLMSGKTTNELRKSSTKYLPVGPSTMECFWA
jgi:hypothetical protein